MKKIEKMILKLQEVAKIHPNAKVIYLGGSAGRGLDDRYSDLDFCILWQKIPSIAEREVIFLNAGMKVLKMSSESDGSRNIADHFEFEGVGVDINSLVFEDILNFSQGFKAIKNLSLDIQELAYALQTGAVLAGFNDMNKIRSSLGRPTDNQRIGSVQNMLNAHWEIELIKSSSRRDWPSYYKILTAAYHDLFRVACLCEHKFYPGPKRHSQYQIDFKKDWLEHLDKFWQESPDNQIIGIKKTIQNFKSHLDQGFL